MITPPDLAAVLEGEEWREAAPKIWVSSLGRAWSSKTGRFLSCTPNHGGHVVIHLGTVNGRRRREYLHTLILELFVGPRPDGHYARHLNDIGTDNRLDNLAWGTPAQNSEDARRNNGHYWARGERASRAKLTESQVLEARKRRADGETWTALAESYGLSQAGIRHAVTKHWRHLDALSPRSE